MSKFVINQGYTSGRYNVEASRFFTTGDFVDFVDEHEETVFRIAANKVATIEREKTQ
ncbi:hypothetical protein AB0C42_33515 [Micromonospora taraxaci]|uniref:hypothetical protein n=1 Tax=Micromonospora taraxaci TaxID=1316803 RepID=UPI0033DCBE09